MYFGGNPRVFSTIMVCTTTLMSFLGSIYFIIEVISNFPEFSKSFFPFLLLALLSIMSLYGLVVIFKRGVFVGLSLSFIIILQIISIISIFFVNSSNLFEGLILYTLFVHIFFWISVLTRSKTFIKVSKLGIYKLDD